MKKKATVLVARICVSLIEMAGIGAVSASDDNEPAVSATVGIINPDGTTTPIKRIEGSGPMMVTVTRNEDGSMNITKNGETIRLPFYFWA